ncbi:hypothetical protein ANN_19646 [Periplaneta americana]|uniref:Uncharacterized protein n=1 Tax=Periplaneta americana TaxID=6978 RepID=A0ABQ8SAH4_PERAM|nr:hypothetical protein ANN_19646 [Periplaneta americana]
MSPGSNTESYPAFAHIGLRENPGKNLNQVTCPDRESNPGHLVSRLDALTSPDYNSTEESVDDLNSADSIKDAGYVPDEDNTSQRRNNQIRAHDQRPQESRSRVSRHGLHGALNGARRREARGKGLRGEGMDLVLASGLFSGISEHAWNFPGYVAVVIKEETRANSVSVYSFHSSAFSSFYYLKYKQSSNKSILYLKWTLRQSEEKRIEVFEMWIWRRMERVMWTDRTRNEAVLERVGEERMMLKLIRKRKRNWLGHWLRRKCLLKDALEEMVNERRVRGRRIYQMIDDIKLYGSYEETKKKTENRKKLEKLGLQ